MDLTATEEMRPTEPLLERHRWCIRSLAFEWVMSLKSKPQMVVLVKLTGAIVDESKTTGPPAPTAGEMRRREVFSLCCEETAALRGKKAMNSEGESAFLSAVVVTMRLMASLISPTERPPRRSLRKRRCSRS